MRRLFFGAVTLLIVSGFGVVMSGWSRKSRAGAALAHPNIVFILTDDLDNTTMPFWKAMPQTRALMRDRGTDFTNNFATNPLCCPSRATILTGKYSHNTGVFDHTPPDGGYSTFVRTGAEKDTVATRLHASGYRTGFMGKYLNGYETESQAVPVGWDEWFGLSGSFLDGYGYTANHNGKTETFGSKPADYQTDVLSREANRFVDTSEKHDSQPFLLFLSPSAPHATIGAAPRDARSPWNKAVPKHFPNYDEPDVSDKPSWLRLGKPQIGAAGTKSLTKRYRSAMASLLAVDDMVGSLAAKLRADGEFDNTIFVFTSDNGNSFGAHRIVNKQVPYEESLRIPLTISGPSIPHRSVGALVTNNDYTPTVLALAGLDPSDLDGRSLVPLLHGGDGNRRKDFLVEYRGTTSPPYYVVDTYADVRLYTDYGTPLLGPPSYRALRTKRYLYVQWYSGAEHEYELYDLHADPYELQNLVPDAAGLQAHAALVGRLQARVDALAVCSGPTCHP